MTGFLGALHHKRSAWDTDTKRGWWPKDRNQRIKLWVAFEASYKGRGLLGKGKLTLAAKSVYRALLFDFLNLARGACFPSYDAIGAKARVSRRAVAYALKQLQACGFLLWQRRRKMIRLGRVSAYIQTSNAYVFAMGLLTLGAECKNCTETHSNILSLTSKGLNRWSERLLGEADKRDQQLQAQKQKWLDYL